MATYSSILAWRIAWTEEPGYSPRGCKEADTTESLTHTHTHTHNAVYIFTVVLNIRVKYCWLSIMIMI